MKKIDRYIIRQFLINFTILLLVLVLLFVLVDFILDMDEFHEAGLRWARLSVLQHQAEALGIDPALVQPLVRNRINPEALIGTLSLTPEQARLVQDLGEPSTFAVWGWTLYQIGDYYGPMVLMLYVFFSGLIVVGAMGFTFSSMARSRELTALLSSGVSLYRVAAPVVITGAALSLVSLPLQELVIPHLATRLARGKSQLKHVQQQSLTIQFASDGEGDLLTASRFEPASSPARLEGVNILQRNEDRVLSRWIHAREAYWDDERSGWLLSDARSYVPDITGAVSAPRATDQAQAFYATSLSPVVLLARQATLYQQLLPIRRLQVLQGNPAVPAMQQARITQILWSRFSLQVLNVLVLVMGLPFFLVRVPENVLVQAMKCAGVCLGVWGGGLVMLQGSATSLPPIAAAWLPVVIALPLSAYLLQSIRT